MNCITLPIYKRRKPQDTVLYQVVQSTFKVEARVRKRVLSLFKRREILTEEKFEELKSWKGCGGFSVNADVQIEEHNRRGAERLIRYCARPAFSGEKLRLIAHGCNMM